MTTEQETTGGTTGPDGGWSAEEARAIERLGNRFAQTGLSRMSARIFAALVISDEGALTAAELCRRLGVSSGTVSTSVQYLTGLGLITRENVPGSRRDLYRVLDDPWPEVFAIRGHWLRDFASSAAEDIGRLDEGTPAAERLATMREFALFVMPKLDDIVHDWRRHRAERARADDPPRP
ncbi:GbsR/MarR family transcriptional regulator [Streptomyces marincola]|uniref:GbsR/MarR family transcriptional regulator n=1 Tax=Streptomyces marincola TaxID=2878388 RepID=UPI001CF5529A|nr:helix-turn-helix domain-containing protein [Streptomyces marincola]UCM91513.1 MarR family transcriptional regulator [Streptomyces marincola]